MADDFEEEEGEPVWLPDSLALTGAELSSDVSNLLLVSRSHNHSL